MSRIPGLVWNAAGDAGTADEATGAGSPGTMAGPSRGGVYRT
jgi:hypothetical protein